MRDATAIIGTLLLLAVVVWWAGALVLRLAAWGWFAFALIGFPLVGEGELDPSAPWVFAAAGVICWTGGHLLFRARRGTWRTPLAARVFPGRFCGAATLSAMPTRSRDARWWRWWASARGGGRGPRLG